MSQEQSKLLSLSTELLDLVLDFTPNAALISIAKTCRRLHYFALPVYLTRHGIQSNQSNLKPECLVLKDKAAVSALPGLSAALFITSINDLWCKIGGPDSSDVKELYRFVYGLSSVSYVALSVISNVNMRLIGDPATDTWNLGFIRLLDTILERGCMSLTIDYGDFLYTSSAMHDAERAHRRRKQPSGVLHIQSPNKLTSFCICSDMLFSPPFYQWTLQTIDANATTITSLSLRAYGVSQDSLSAITLPSLTSLSAETEYISFPTLVLFLRRHPTITTLTLYPYFPHPGTVVLSAPNSQYQNTSNNLVPRLVALGGFPGNVTALLSLLHPDTALRVRGITLVFPMHTHVYNPSDFDALTAQIVRAVKGARPTSLTLRISYLYKMLRPIWASEDHDHIPSVVQEALLDSVETVVFSTEKTPALGPWFIGPPLSTWLGASFVNLKNVRFSTNCLLGVDDVCGRETLEQSIKDSCPGVRNVVFEPDSWGNRDKPFL